MPLDCEEAYVILCEDIRQEVRNKVSLLGVYGTHIVVADVPARLESLAFSAFIVGPRVDLSSVKASLINPDGSEVLLVDDELEIAGESSETLGAGHHLAFKVKDPVLEEEGVYVFRLEFNGDPKQRLEKKFRLKRGKVEA